MMGDRLQSGDGDGGQVGIWVIGGRSLLGELVIGHHCGIGGWSLLWKW